MLLQQESRASHGRKGGTRDRDIGRQSLPCPFDGTNEVPGGDRVAKMAFLLRLLVQRLGLKMPWVIGQSLQDL